MYPKLSLIQFSGLIGQIENQQESRRLEQCYIPLDLVDITPTECCTFFSNTHRIYNNRDHICAIKQVSLNNDSSHTQYAF